MISAQTLRVCREGKPVPTFPDHALGFGSLFRDLPGGFPGFRDGAGLGTRARPAGRFFQPLGGGFPAFGEALAAFLEAPIPLPADLAAGLALLLAPLAIRFTAAAFLAAFASTAPLAAT